MPFESVLVVNASSIKYGSNATAEVGFDMKQLGTRRVMVVADPNLMGDGPAAVVLESLRREGIGATPYDRVRIEPTDASFRDAIRFAVDGNFDGYVAVGGGSTIDTAKVANLYATHPADFLAYVNPPLGEGRPVPGPLRPLIAIPTTAGTGSEATGVAIFDFTERHVKTGISHRHLRPTLGIVDPNNTRTLPRLAAACTGFDVLCHADRVAYGDPLRPATCARQSRGTATVSGRQSHQRHLGRAFDPDGREQSALGRRASRR